MRPFKLLNQLQTESCTVVLLMLFKFNPYELPGRLPHGRSIADIVTFHQVYDAATNLERHCIGPGGSGQAGWQPVGTYTHPSLGLAVVQLLMDAHGQKQVTLIA